MERNNLIRKAFSQSISLIDKYAKYGNGYRIDGIAVEKGYRCINLHSYQITSDGKHYQNDERCTIYDKDIPTELMSVCKSERYGWLFMEKRNDEIILDIKDNVRIIRGDKATITYGNLEDILNSKWEYWDIKGWQKNDTSCFTKRINGEFNKRQQDKVGSRCKPYAEFGLLIETKQNIWFYSEIEIDKIVSVREVWFCHDGGYCILDEGNNAIANENLMDTKKFPVRAD